MAKKNSIMGLPWWAWVGGGAAILYFTTRKSAKAGLMPAEVIPLSQLQDQLAIEIGGRLGMKSEDLIINIGGAAGPVTILDRRNNKVILTTTKSPATLLNFVRADGIDKYYVDPMTAGTSLWDRAWSSAPITV
jgi:hypothetical protein